MDRRPHPSYAYQEQFTAVQPAFTPPAPRADEVSRLELMRAMTPLRRLRMGSEEWRFTDYASTQRDRDGRLPLIGADGQLTGAD